MSKPTIAIISPLPPSRSGIADYVAEQLPFLARYFDIVAVIADSAPHPTKRWEGVTVRRWRSFASDTSTHSIPRIYHLGNNPDHAYMFRDVATHPGITVLHDFLMHHLVAGMTLAKDDPAGYSAYLQEDYGNLADTFARQREAGFFTEFQHFLLPLNGSVLRNSLGVIVHSHSSLARIENLHPRTKVRHIRLHLGPTPAGFVEDSREAARHRLGFSRDKLILTSMGLITPSKQIEMCLKALKNLRSSLPPFEYLLVGERSSTYNIDRLIREYQLQDVVRVVGYVDLIKFHEYMQAADVVFNLRYPSAGETSAALIRTLGMGRPAVIFDYGTFADYPADICVKLPLAPEDTSHLERAILALASSREDRLALEARCRSYVQEHFQIEKCIDGYVEFMREVFPTLREDAAQKRVA